MGRPCYPDMPHSKGEDRIEVKQESKMLPLFARNESILSKEEAEQIVRKKSHKKG